MLRILVIVAASCMAANIGTMTPKGDGTSRPGSVSPELSERLAVRKEPVKALSERGLRNLEALARVVGYVRHYHPSDEAAALDWNRFVVDSIGPAEQAANARDLSAAMRTTFLPIAPAVTFQTAKFDGAFQAASMVGQDEHPTGTIRWKHRGFGPNADKGKAIYVSERVTFAVSAAPEAGLPVIGECVTRECPLVGGDSLWVRVPIVLYTDEAGTLPRAKSSYAPPEAGELSADDRATRLAAVIVGWNVLQHFFPYFDVIKDDWGAALREALTSAATDADSEAFRGTLEKLITHLHDGHGHIVSRSTPVGFSLPLLLTFVGDEPVVLRPVGEATARGVQAGDVLVAVARTPVERLIEEARTHEPAATVGFFHHRAARRIGLRSSADPVEVQVRGPGGKDRTVSLTPIAPHQLPPERGGPVVSEPRPGVWYVDLDRATDKDLAAALPKLAEAKGVVLDMRGNPNAFSMGFLGHFTDEAVKCARWEIPLANWPDREHMDFDHARWDLPPLGPPITARTTFITDGRAISAAETFLGIVEAYTLADIVGEPTAGTNGNVNSVALPGGYSCMFTGMKVLKHDGSQHHGIGIKPTIPVHRTVAGIAAGTDEMLEKALDTVTVAK